MVLTPKQIAESKGYTVDTCSSGCWTAYVGARFAPTLWFELPTDREWWLYYAARQIEFAPGPITDAVREIAVMLEKLEEAPCQQNSTP